MIYSTCLANNASGGYLEKEDKLTGFETLSLANISGLLPMERFDSTKDQQMESVDASRFFTVLMDLAATLVFMGIIILRIRWRIYPSDYAVKLTNISKDFKGDIEKEIRSKLESKFGRIHEIAVVKDTGEILSYQLQLHRVTNEIGDIKAKNEILGVNSSK